MVSNASGEEHVDSNGNGSLRPAENWASLAGLWTFEGNRATYNGPDEKAVRPEFGVALSSYRLKDGYVVLDVELSRNERTTAGVVLGFQSLQSNYFVAQLGAFDSAYAISEFKRDLGWQSLTRAGRLKNLIPHRPYHMEVGLEGQKVRLKVDDVNVLETVLPSPLEHAGFGLFAWDDAAITFENVCVRRDALKAFVMMPFREPFDALYKDVIFEVAARRLGFEVTRVDEIVGPGIIMDDIRQKIDEAHVVVAEISSPNPNVFYELGYAHALGKPAVLLARREVGKDLPFDIRGYRAIFYDDTIGGKKSVEEQLQRHLEAVERDL